MTQKTCTELPTFWILQKVLWKFKKSLHVLIKKQYWNSPWFCKPFLYNVEYVYVLNVILNTQSLPDCCTTPPWLQDAKCWQLLIYKKFAYIKCNVNVFGVQVIKIQFVIAFQCLIMIKWRYEWHVVSLKAPDTIGNYSK